MLDIYSEEDMLVCLNLDLGLCSTVWHGNKQVVRVGSISFAAMDETEFERFYSRCVDVILEKYLRGTSRQDLLDEIASLK